MVDLAFRSAKYLAGQMRRGKLGASELLEHYLDRILRFDPAVNAVVVRTIETAQARAVAADAALARGEIWGPLHGVPMTVKEAFEVAGTPTTWGMPEFADNVPQHNAVAVNRLLAAGAIILGKTNVPRGLSDWQSFNDLYGTTNNPFDLERGPGGSSGGSAAALAAGLTALEIGSDIGASIRNPAHYCGVYGHKPTYRLLTMRGHELPGMASIDSMDIAVIGPMARSAADLGLALGILAGADAVEARGWQVRLPKPVKKRLADYRVALVCDDPVAPVDGTVQASLGALGEFLRAAGATVSEAARPQIDSAEAFLNYLLLLRSQTSNAVTDEAFAESCALIDRLPLGASRDEDYPTRMHRGQALRHRDWLALNERRHQMRLVWDAFFADYDLLLCPAAPTPAFHHNQTGERWERMLSVNGEPQPSTTGLFWAGYAGNVYLPATVAPIEPSPKGLPIGVQIIGRQYDDLTCIHFASLLEREYRGFVPPPDFAR